MAQSTTARGYGAAHQQERARWVREFKKGEAINCFRCNEPIDPDGPWDLGHNDDRTAWTGPEHVKCNRSAGGTNGAAVTNQKKTTIIRDW